jgi:NAD-dependent deacetylase
MSLGFTINFNAYQNIVVLTGAGVSVASGLPTYRGEDAQAIWNKVDPRVFATARVFEEQPEVAWEHYGQLRHMALNAQPNPAHIALANIESSLPHEANYVLVTQNIDGLHHAAGSQNVIEYHGSIRFTRCSNKECSLQSFEDAKIYGTPPSCPECGSTLRPDITMFNEFIDTEKAWKVKRALRDCDLFISIGTSGTVSPAADFARGADYAGARTIVINPEPMSPANPYFKEEVLEKAEDVLPSLAAIMN